MKTLTNDQKKSFGTILNYCEKTECTMYYYEGEYIFFSIHTGYHGIKQDVFNRHGFMDYDQVEKRAKIHWEGFLKNQPTQ